MTRAKNRLWGMAAALVSIGTGVACANLGDASSLKSSPKDNATDDGTNGGARDPAPASASPGAPAATGVVLVHAGAFPAFRLCFEHAPEKLPQPDSRIMPNANVVGVEVGSVVRIDPLQAPGKIYVIDESRIRQEDGLDKTCGELIEGTKPVLRKTNDYLVANSLEAPLGTTGVTVLAMTGCGSQAFLDQVNTKSAICESYDQNASNYGNLAFTAIDIPTTPNPASASEIHVQLLQLSPPIEALRKKGNLEITFGDLDGDGGAGVPILAGKLLGGSPPTTLAVDQTDTTVYGNKGFRVKVTAPDGGFEFTQSLASVQDLSSPHELPTSYYRAASNYALLLLGDPGHQALSDAAADDPRRGVHILAVPVIDPATLDAGADADVDAAGDSSAP